MNRILLLLLPLLVSFSFAANSTLQKENFSKIYHLDKDEQLQKNKIKYYIKHAKYCLLSTKKDQEILDLYPNAIIRNGHKNNVKLFVITDDENRHQTLVIRGSSNFKNWVANAKFWKIKDKWARGAKVHKGFYEVAREIYKLARPLLNPSYATTITGHSLGGAAGTLISLYLERVSFRNTTTVTFGAPRLTNSNGAKLLNNINLQRVNHEDDIVTKLPPKFLAYRHFGQSFKLSQHKILTDNQVEDDSEDSQEVLDTWKQLENNEIDVQANIPSHFIKNYLKRLYSLLQK